MEESKQAQAEPQEVTPQGENEANEFDKVIKNSLAELEQSVSKRSKVVFLERQDIARSKVEKF